ncbi:hypothetical protein BDZ97DRAFT_1777173 [Flammula alnicola]|nr:hypothetical protein BDZ97DRAFT_1777173 [Flammula alnicola]
MSTTTMHFGPEWMRTKHQPLSRLQPPSPPPSNTVSGSGLSTYSALVSATPPSLSEASDEVHPFRYSKDELLRIYQEGGRGGLGLEVERWEGVVREAGAEPIALREMTETEKKLFAGSLNSELRRRPSQSTDFLSPLNTSSLDRPRLTHSTSSSTNSPLRERFGALKRRDSGAAGPSDTTMLNLPRKPSLSALQAPALSPREASPRTRVGYTPSFDGVLNNGESWVARRRSSEASMKTGNGQGREATDTQQTKTSGIREEKEDESGESSRHSGEDQSFFPPSSPYLHTEEPRQYSTVAGGTDATTNGVQAESFPPTNGTTNPSIYGNDRTEVGPPPGLIDLAAVEWSYKDPTGQVQGPFRADLMQKWYNDGYFSPDLPMRRIRYDTHWTTVEELTRRANGENIFLSPLVASTTVNRDDGSPLQSYQSSDNVFNEPFQPAPIRTLRTSTLESYLNAGSLPSDSPSSSFGASHFGNPSPDPSAFGGREVKPYFGGDPTGRLAAFGIQDHPSPFPDRLAIGHDFPNNATNLQQGPSFGNFMSDRDPTFNPYGFNNPPVPHDPWMVSSNNIPSSVFVGSRDPAGRPESTHKDPLARTFGQGVVYTNDHLGGFNGHLPGSNDLPQNYGHYDFNGQTPFHNVQDQPQFASPRRELNESTHKPNTLFGFRGLNVDSAGSQSPQNELSNLPTVPAQSSWQGLSDPLTSQRMGIPEIEQAGPATSVPHPAPSAPQSPWSRVDQISIPASQPTDSATFNAPLEKDDKTPWRNDAPPSNLTAGNLGQHNQQQISETPHKPVIVPVEQKVPTKTSHKVPQATQQTPASQPAPADSQAGPVVPKIAWVKEEEGKRKKSSTPSMSLREIQEAEAKKLETRKAAEREKEKLARASLATETKEDVQPFITSWGLPTSQAGARGSVPSREVSSPPALVSATTPVWTTALKQPAVKKTMKEIQEEEEIRRKLALKEVSVPVVSKRGYAETTTKVAAAPPSSTATNNVWTTVGPSGKTSAAVPSPVRSITQTSTPVATNAGVSPLSRVSGSPVQRNVVNSALKTRPVANKQDDFPETPSHDFLKWLSDSLKGLNSSVNVEEIVSMLLSFPLDPDASTIEIISDTIYSNSTTLDGRRFASEFVSKRKADARSKSASTSGKAPAKPVSIADVVKATPKAAQPEWGFKVVNKKKKGGRS